MGWLNLFSGKSFDKIEATFVPPLLIKGMHTTGFLTTTKFFVKKILRFASRTRNRKFLESPFFVKPYPSEILLSVNLEESWGANYAGHRLPGAQ
jgi:hypothetical protein